MPALLARDRFSGLDVGADERLARSELRRQIGHLEHQLAGLLGEAFGRVEIDYRVAALAGAGRVLGLGDLERLRDELADRVAEARRTLRRRAEVEAANRQLLKEMVAAPQDFKWVKVTRHEVGEPGCGAWHSRPLLGPIGMLMGWWRVKVSSGCPLAGRLAAVERQAQGKAEEASRRDGGERGEP
ncbi:MAG TPA: hypothetical protein VF731_09740 [Solirubrobacterales bacterium]